MRKFNGRAHELLTKKKLDMVRDEKRDLFFGIDSTSSSKTIE